MIKDPQMFLRILPTSLYSSMKGSPVESFSALKLALYLSYLHRNK